MRFEKLRVKRKGRVYSINHPHFTEAVFLPSHICGHNDAKVIQMILIWAERDNDLWHSKFLSSRGFKANGSINYLRPSSCLRWTWNFCVRYQRKLAVIYGGIAFFRPPTSSSNFLCKLLPQEEATHHLPFPCKYQLKLS